jgi:hypothetical protein
MNTATRALLLLALLTIGCAAQQHIRKGEALLKEAKYAEAVASFEEALRIEPNNKQADAGIRAARREAVTAELQKAEKALKAGDYAKALSITSRARRMPMDLEDVQLVRRLDDTLSEAAKGAQERVKQWSDVGQFVPAVELADAVVSVSPGEVALKQWAEALRAQAAAHYMKLAEELTTQGLRGSAAVQLAMARQVGASVTPSQVVGLWNQFVEPICFATPKVRVNDGSGKAGTLVQTIETAALTELTALREACGEGTRPLGVSIDLITVSIVDESSSLVAAKALPGSGVQTEETYVEEIPYTETEEVTEYETRTEKQEKRDCAPRPGKERGCTTWIEDVEVKVPVKKTREVQKTRRVEKTRPAKGPFPADKVVTYEITSVRRQVLYEGKVRVEGATGDGRAFKVMRDSSDSGHPAVQHERLSVPADPMEAKPLDELLGSASENVSAEVKAAVATAVVDWSASYAEEARQKVLEGRLPQAEELFLRRLALGVQEDQQLAKFFTERYGKTTGDVLVALLAAMGREVDKSQKDAGMAMRFPKKDTAAKDVAQEAPETIAPAAAKATTAAAAPEKATDKKPDVSAMADDDMKALEAASMGEEKKPEQPVTDPNAAPAPPSEEQPAAQPRRGPIVPK